MPERKKYNWRKFFNDIHLWLGIGSGLILFVVCLSGTLYTFRSEVEEWLEPAKYQVEPQTAVSKKTVEALSREIEIKTEGKVAAISIPHDPGKAYQLTVKKPGEQGRGTQYFVNPYTAEIQGTSESAASDFFMFLFRMHRWLLLDTDIGRPIVGTATIIFAMLVLTGLVLWWPKKIRNWKQGLKIKTNANWKRVNHDLHNTFGFYAFLLLLVMSLTGLCWSFQWYREGLSHLLGTEVFGGRNEQPLLSELPAAEGAPLPAEEFLQNTESLLPYPGDYRIVLPDEAEGTVTVSKYRTGFFAPAAPDKLVFDQYSGAVLSLEKFEDKPISEQIASSIKPLHTGEIFGTFSKILYFLACLIASSLPVTGTIIWINKLGKKPGKKRRATSRSNYQPAGTLD